MDPRLRDRLRGYPFGKSRLGKGTLSVALVVTDRARRLGLPLDPQTLITEGGGQVQGLSRGAVQAILRRNGIGDVLAREGGRTSRKSVAHMQQYVSLLNELHEEDLADLDAIESHWIHEVRRFLAGKPFRLDRDPNQSLRSVISKLFEQAFRRQRSAEGRTDAGALLQHLVGAKLACALRPEVVKHHSYATADTGTGRAGDFAVGDTVFHVTTAPSDAVIKRCQDNLAAALRPVLITLENKTSAAFALAEIAGIKARIDIFDIEQFLALNILEWGRFRSEHRQTALDDLLEEYNRIVEENETDHSLKIESSA